MGIQHRYQKLENNNTPNKPLISNITQLKRQQKMFLCRQDSCGTK